MPKLKIKTGDTVVVVSGKDKGKQGKILAAFPNENKVIVDGVNVAVKHQKPKNAQDKGGLVNVNLKIDVSNVKLICPVCKKASRIGYKIVNGEKVRYCKKCGKVLDSKVKDDAKAKTNKNAAVVENVTEQVKEAKAANTKKVATNSTNKPQREVKSAAPKATAAKTTGAKTSVPRKIGQGK